MRVRACAMTWLLVAALAVSIYPPAQAALSIRPDARDNGRTYLVRWVAGTTLADRSDVLGEVGAAAGSTIPAIHVTRVWTSPRVARFLRSHPLVDWVEREEEIRTLGRPNDPLLTYQWAVHRIKVVRAWGKELGTRYPVTVAVVDTGVDLSHPDLGGRFVPGADFDQVDLDPSDPNGHGTHVSGVIAANAGNRAGIAGLSWGAKVMPLRACNQGGGCADHAVASSMVHGILTGARVVNLSLGGPDDECRGVYRAVADLALRRGVLLVAASGNSADDGNPTIYPAACDGYFGVGATNAADEHADFSSFGAWVDVSAPGATVLSTLPPRDERVFFPGYGFASGTSMAAPHVAGLAALIFSLHPRWTPARVARRIMKTAVDLGRPGRDPRFGAGRINALAALRG